MAIIFCAGQYMPFYLQSHILLFCDCYVNFYNHFQICIWIYMRFSKTAVALEVAELFFSCKNTRSW